MQIYQQFILCFLCMPLSMLNAQVAKISEKTVQLNTYLFSDPNPVPECGKIFPYFRYDGYSDRGSMHNWKMIEMENEYIKLWVVPGVGGKIWGATEKSTGKEFVYYNHAVKFRDVAMRGPWTSGGIEMNFGVIGHAPSCSTPVDYMIRENDDGSVSCFVGAIDLPSHTRWSVEINLPKDKAYFTTHAVWDNPTEQEQSYYHWMNMGIKTAGNLEYIFPGKYHLGHDGRNAPWPTDEQGRKISFYDNNNFGSYKSYHVFGEATGFYGAYWHNDDFGFVHYASYDDKPGKKIWIWGLSNQGMIWEKLLTDTDGQYTELQSGRLFNQAAENSSLTPFKNRGFIPGSTDEWTEYWFPVKGTQGLKYASPVGSVNIEPQNNKVRVWFCPNEAINGILEVRDDKVVIFSKEIHSGPMQSIAESFDYRGDYQKLSVWLNNELLYQTDRSQYEVKRPVESPSDFNWETAYGHYLKGKELERQRLYKEAENEYGKALEKEPWFVPALTGVANLSYRKTDYEISLEYALKTLSVDTYDPEANMIYGLAAIVTGDTTSAIDGFSIASASVLERTAAFNALASVFLRKNDFTEALHYAEKSLLYNQTGSEAVQLKILCLRKLGLQGEADRALSELTKKDPLNHFIRFERYLMHLSSANKTDVQKYISNELPWETYLEYALWYVTNGQLSDALNILELAPENHAIVLLWEGYLNHLSGNEPLAVDFLKKAMDQNPGFVFPFRVETLKPLEWAKTLSDNWKISYYQGLIYLDAGAVGKARDAWIYCRNLPDFYPFYIARVKIEDAQSQQAQSDVEQSLKFAGDDWRPGLFASRFYFDRGNTQRAEELALSFYRKHPQNYYLGLQYANVLEMNKKYTVCISLLKSIQVLPNEGTTDGRIIWRNANIGNALDCMRDKQYRKSLQSISMAREWPVNLGVGKPYEVDERLEDFMAMQCYVKLKDSRSAGKLRDKIAEENLSGDVNDFLTAWILKEKGNKSEADRIMNGLLGKNPSSKVIQWCNAIFTSDHKQIEGIAKEIGDNDQTFLFLQRLFNE